MKKRAEFKKIQQILDEFVNFNEHIDPAGWKLPSSNRSGGK